MPARRPAGDTPRGAAHRHRLAPRHRDRLPPRAGGRRAAAAACSGRYCCHTRGTLRRPRLRRHAPHSRRGHGLHPRHCEPEQHSEPQP
ncbi:MAG: hypothetical protein J5486_04240 [Bacteroidaceae bacterium]|nr:hypothetical protein [Bacteroidaceae bacterium]